MSFRHIALAVIITLLAVPPKVGGQAKPVDCAKVNDSAADHANMDHAAHMTAINACATAARTLPTLPTLPGQATFGAISEVVRILKADPNTDWSKVNIEALRQHLIDMDLVTMRAAVTQRSVPEGAEMDVTGDDRTAAAIKRMVVNQARMLEISADYLASTRPLSNGVRLTVTAKNASDPRSVAMIRGLGFIGLMTEGDHHVAHHLAVARGDANPHGH